MARNSVVSLAREGTTVTVTVRGHAPFVVDVAAMPRELLILAAMHGVGQKLVDAAAISRDPANGRAADEGAKYEAIRPVYDRLMAGEWNAPREGGGAGSMLLRALCALKPGVAPERLKAWLDGKSKAEQAALRASPDVAREIERIRAATSGAGSVDTDEMLDELANVG